MDKGRRILRYTIGILAGVVVVLLIARSHVSKSSLPAPVTSPSTASDDLGSVAPFSLTDRSGKQVSLEELKGHVWLADFVYTRCPGPCPLLTGQAAQLQKEFSSAKDFKIVSITVDPEHDTPSVLDAYAKNFGANPDRWYFLTGDKTVVYQMISQNFKLAVQQVPADPKNPTTGVPEFIHSLNFVLVDRDGRIRGYYNGTDAEAVERLRAALKTQLG